MKKAWTFSEFFKIAIKDYIHSGEKLETVEMLLIGYQKTKRLSPTTCSRYINGNPINREIIDDILAMDIEAIASRIKNYVNVTEFSLCAENVLRSLNSNEYDISDQVLWECRKLFSNQEYEKLLATAFRSAVAASNRKTSGTFDVYYKNVRKTYGKMKTLLYASKERPVKGFYVCNSIRPAKDVLYEFRKSAEENVQELGAIHNPTLKKLLQEAQYILLTGEAGIGKSMLMRHFLLQAVSAKEEYGNLPVLVMLREYKGKSTSLLELIAKAVKALDASVSDETIQKSLQDGKVKLLLDGVDEIREKDTSDFVTELNGFIAKYPDNQYVLSSRRYSNFVEMRWVAIYEILPFSKDQAVELINRLEYLPDTPKHKEDFLERLKNEYYDTHRAFASNPLLLTLMLLTYQQFGPVPQKKYLFYKDAYSTLLLRHDAKNKPGYRREFLCVDDPDEFTILFREFCARTYHDSQFEFDEREMEKYFLALRRVKELSETPASEPKNKLTFDHYLKDVTKNVNLMFEAGGKYLFRHRSFQEYFFADYYSRADDAAVRRLGLYLQDQFHSTFDNNEALDILFEIGKDKVEPFIFLPYLSDLFEHRDEAKIYRYFLSEMIDTLYYFVFRKAEIELIRKQNPNVEVVLPKLSHELSDTKSTVMYWIIKANGQSKAHRLFEDNFDDSIRYEKMQRFPLFGMLHKPSIDGKVILDVGSNLDETIRNGSTMFEQDANNHRIVFGEICLFPMENIVNKPEEYPELLKRLEAPDFPLRTVFNWLKSYYETIKKRYAREESSCTEF